MSAWTNGNPLNQDQQQLPGSFQAGGFNMSLGNDNDKSEMENSSRLGSWTVPGESIDLHGSLNSNSNPAAPARSQTAPPGLSANANPMGYGGSWSNGGSFNSFGNTSNTNGFPGTNVGAMGSNFNPSFQSFGYGQQQQQNQFQQAMMGSNFGSNPPMNFGMQLPFQQTRSNSGDDSHSFQPQQGNNQPPNMFQQQGLGAGNMNPEAAQRRMQQIQQQAMLWMQQQMQSQGLGGGDLGNFNPGTFGMPTVGQPDGPAEEENAPVGNVGYNDNGDNHGRKLSPKTHVGVEKGRSSSPNSNKSSAPRQPKRESSADTGSVQVPSGMRRFADVAASSSPDDAPAKWPTIRAANPIVKTTTSAPSTQRPAGVPPPVAVPAQTRPGPSNTEAKYYQVEFRAPRRDIFVGYDDSFRIGDLVKVEADRGEDLGKLIHMWTADEFASWLSTNQGGNNRASSSKYHKRMLRLATADEVRKCDSKRIEEDEALEVCRAKAEVRKLPMKVVSAEYQFDRHKLTFFFEADRRIDFRELVRDLFALYKTRIWLQQMSAVAMASAAPGAKRERDFSRSGRGRD